MANNSVSEKNMREHIRQELARKLKCCANTTYQCSLPRLDGYDYCVRHILKDSKSHFRVCSFVYNNGRKCPNPVPRYDLKKDSSMTTLCYQHSRQLQLKKAHESARKNRPVDSNESFLNNLSHHILIEDDDDDDEDENEDKSVDTDEEIDVVSPYVPQFHIKDQIQPLELVQEASRKQPRFIDYGSDTSSSGDERPTIKTTFQSNELNESDNESCSEEEDPLRHAGVYTREEVIKIALQKTVKLRELYLEQLDTLQHVLREKRRRYLIDLKKERDTLCSITDQVKQNPSEMVYAREMKALNGYHRRHGQESLLFKKFKEKRTRQNDIHAYKGQSYIKCIFSEGGVKCSERCLPCCKYCRKHILEDKRQVLFKACNVERGGVICQEPVPRIYEESACNLHTKIPTSKTYVQKKYESDTDDDPEEKMKRLLAARAKSNFTLEIPPTISYETFVDQKTLVLPEIKLEDMYPSSSTHLSSYQTFR